jgi:serine/threonine-protein kinase PknG
VSPSRGSFPDARLRRARLLVDARRTLLDLSDAVAGLDGAHVPDRPKAEVTVDALAGALGLVTRGGPDPSVRVAGAEATEPALRDRLELALRTLAHLTDDRPERVALVDRANSVRRWTLR